MTRRPRPPNHAPLRAVTARALVLLVLLGAGVGVREMLRGERAALERE